MLPFIHCTGYGNTKAISEIASQARILNTALRSRDGWNRLARPKAPPPAHSPLRTRFTLAPIDRIHQSQALPTLAKLVGRNGQSISCCMRFCRIAALMACAQVRRMLCVPLHQEIPSTQTCSLLPYTKRQLNTIAPDIQRFVVHLITIQNTHSHRCNIHPINHDKIALRQDAIRKSAQQSLASKHVA